MANPNNPIPLEDVAVQYILEAMQAEGVVELGNPVLDVFVRKFYGAMFRGYTHFLLDHLYVNDDDLVTKIANHPDAYLNE